MTDSDFKRIGDEFERLLGPVYEQLDRMEEKQDRMELKQDANIADIMQLQKETGAIFDKLKDVDDKLDALDNKLTGHIREDREEHDKIRKFVGMPKILRDNNF